jgi:hypothetical protein
MEKGGPPSESVSGRRSVRPVNHPLDNDVYLRVLVLEVEKILTSAKCVCRTGPLRGVFTLTTGDWKFR